MHSGQNLWKRAKALIPGGNQLLSKRVERFLPGLWPAYYERAEGCRIWDMDGNEYIDFAQMGVGSCVLGYADPDVNRAVGEAIAKGAMSTLNSYEEVELAERLVGLHPWADMARFGRTGGEACAIAVRIARAASGKGRVAFCGYHGWHDWYLAANLQDGSSLDDQLLPGLDPAGLWPGLQGSAVPFEYNRADQLKALAEKHDDIGVIIMEPTRSHDPAPGFLEEVRAIADRIGAVLIFDEVTSGFRMNMGGIHLRTAVEPDMAVFGKALGNGFPVAAIIGRATVMDHAQDSFISSTMWTERTGFAAALATLDKLDRERGPEKLIAYGEAINAQWRQAAERTGLDIHVDGIPPLTHLSFAYDNPLAVQTLFAQEMLERGYLAGAAAYTCLAYSDEIIADYGRACGQVFTTIKDALDAGDLLQRLKGEVIQPGFKRLT